MSSTLRTTSALSKSLALALSEILYERCFYVFHAATPSVEQLLKKLVQNAAIQTSSFEFLKEFESLAKHVAVVTPKMNGSEIHGEFTSHSRSLTSYANQESSSSPISNEFSFKLWFKVVVRNNDDDDESAKLPSVARPHRTRPHRNGRITVEETSEGANDSQKSVTIYENGRKKMQVWCKCVWKKRTRLSQVARTRPMRLQLLYSLTHSLIERHARQHEEIPTRAKLERDLNRTLNTLDMLEPNHKSRVKEETNAYSGFQKRVEVFPIQPIGYVRGSLRNMHPRAFFFISLYSGVGVTARGLTDAGGFAILFAEKNPHRMAILKRNHPTLEPWQFVQNVEDITQNLVDRVAEKYGRIDVVEAGVRCDDVSNRNPNRGTKPLETVMKPFQPPLEVLKMAERANEKQYSKTTATTTTTRKRKREESEARAPVVLIIENVLGFLGRWTKENKEPAYAIALFIMLAKDNMSFTIRTLNAHDSGLDHSKERVFLVASCCSRRVEEKNGGRRNSWFGPKREYLSFTEQILCLSKPHTCAGECKHCALSSRGCSCFECENKSRLKREKQRAGASLETRRFALFDASAFDAVITDGTTTLCGLTQTNASRLIIIDRTGELRPRFLRTRDLCVLCGVSRNHFFGSDETSDSEEREEEEETQEEEEEEEERRTANMSALGESPTASLPRFLGNSIVKATKAALLTSPVAADGVFLDEAKRAKWAKKLIEGKITFQWEYGVSFDGFNESNNSSSSSNNNSNEDAEVDTARAISLLLRGLKRTKEKLSTPMTARFSGAFTAQQNMFEKSKLFVSEEQLRGIREHLNAHRNAEKVLRIDARQRRALGITNKESFVQLTRIVRKALERKKKKNHPQLVFMERERGEEVSSFATPLVRINRTMYELGFDIVKSTCDDFATNAKRKDAGEECAKNQTYLDENENNNSDELKSRREMHQQVAVLRKIMTTSLKRAKR